MLDSTTKVGSCIPCGLQKPVRNYYFDGKLLTSRDFIAEQDYLRGHRQLHNSLLHGTGTVCGLKFIQHPSADCRDSFIVMEAGMALDCCGQEIIVPEPTLLRVREMVEGDLDLQLKLDGNHDLVISLMRNDSPSEPLPILLPGCDGEVGATEYGRVCESFAVKLSARASSTSDAQTIASSPKLEWLHTIPLGAQSPTALHVNDGEQLLQIAADVIAGGAHLYAHSLSNHDLVSLLEAPNKTSDTSASRVTGLIFGAGTDSPATDAGRGIRIWRQSDIRDDASPLAILGSESEHARIAVSPTSGALFVLDQRSDSSTRLVSYSAEALNNWLASSPAPGSQPDTSTALSINQVFGDETSAYRRGATMMKVSPNGRWLALLAQAPRTAANNTTPLYLIDTATFSGGSMTLTDARVKTDDLDLTGDEEYCSLDWSLDGERLYIMSTRKGDEESIQLNRYALTGSSNTIEKRGRGVSLPGTATDLAVSPTERRLYVLMRSLEGDTIFTTVDNERIKAFSDEGADRLVEFDDSIKIDGNGQNLAITQNGTAAYIAASDAEPEDQPKRGLVAVVDISEGDCGTHFLDALEGCKTCDTDNHHSVELGHLKNYQYDEANKPLMMNPGEASDADAEIDNLKYRTIVPSSATLKQVTECILEQGIAEGPPGPRGDTGSDGVNGEDGLSIDTVEVDTVEPGTPATGEVTENEDGLTLRLEIPTGNTGGDGDPGRSITQVDVTMIGATQPPTGTTTPIAGTTDESLLSLRLPRSTATTPQPTAVNQIIGMSWLHGQAHQTAFAGNVSQFLVEKGIAVVFAKEVLWAPFEQRTRQADDSLSPVPLLAELQHRIAVGDVSYLWASMNCSLLPINDFAINPSSDNLVDDWAEGHTDPDGKTAIGFALRINKLPENFSIGTLRLVFHTDFVVDVDGLPLDGNHIGGQLATGNVGPGDTFRSWFDIVRG